MTRKAIIVLVSLAIGAVATALSSLYDSSSYVMGLGNTGSWYGLPLGYSLYYTNELMGSRLFHYFSYLSVFLDFLFWTFVVMTVFLGFNRVVRRRLKAGTLSERQLV